jgi:caffeoyl-CoA O-methyltransferase
MDDIPKEARAVLDRLAQWTRDGLQYEGERIEFWSIDEPTGRFLNLLIRLGGFRRILEIGASGGYSGIWLALAARVTGGEVLTLEQDPRKVRLATENYREAGVDAHITVIAGDARRTVYDIDGPLDVVFIDAWKSDYVHYFEAVWPKVRAGGLVIADNVISHAAELGRYRDVAFHASGGRTLLVPIGSGLEVTEKPEGY